MRIVRVRICSVVFALVCLASEREAKSNVEIWNRCYWNGVGQVIYAHCKSGDDDIGEHYMQPDTNLKWSFHSIAGGGTLFWCHFRWIERHLYQNFIVWHQGGRYDMPVGCGQCGWMIDSWGFHIWDKRGTGHYQYYKQWLKEWEEPPALQTSTINVSPGNWSDQGAV